MVGIVFVLGYLGVLKSDWLSSFLIQIVIISAIPLVMYSLLVSKNVKKTFSDFGFKKLSTKLLLISLAIAVVLYFLNIFIANSFHSLLSLFGYELAIPTLTISNKDILTDFFLSACLPGLCEELLHRGMMLNGCKKQGYTRYGLIFSSILFGLMHLNISQFFYATALGFMMGIAVLSTESIWTGVICHFTNNFLSIYFSFNKHLPLQDAYDFIQNKFYNLNSISVVIILTIGVFGLFYLYKYLIKLAKNEKIKQRSEEIAHKLSLEGKTDEEAKDYIESINENLIKLNNLSNQVKDKTKPKFTEKVFLYPSLFMGFVITILTFIMGLI